MGEGFVNTKVCTKCGVEKPYDDFYRNARYVDGFRSQCISCCCEASSQWAQENRKNAHDRERRVGLSPEAYDDLWESQGGLCAICKKVETARTRNGNVRELAADHDHEDGTIRGLLCNACNMGLGMFRDDPVRLMAALQYLADSSLDEDDSRAAEPRGEVSDTPSENSGSTPTAATKLILPEGPEASVCIWCLKQPCVCNRLVFPERRRSGTEVG